MTLRKKQETIRRFDSILKTTCGNCPAGCGMKVFKKGNEVVDIFGDEDHPVNKGSLCPKGLLAYDHLANPDRLDQPAIREHLDEPFRKATWEEALAFTARKLAESTEASGPGGIYIHGTEASPFDYLAGASLFADAASTSNGPSRFVPPAFSPSGSLHKMFGVPGSQLLMNSPRDWCNSRCILLYGCDLAATDPITMGSLIDARDRNIPLIAIDSKRSVTTNRASLSVRIKPGTGAALLRGILRIVIEKGLVNNSFLKEWAEGFEELKAQVLPFTPETTSERCGIAVEELHRLAETVGGHHPLQVIAGDWFTRRFLTDEELALCGALVAVNGSPGMSGGGLNLLDTSPFSGVGSGTESSPLHLESALLDPASPVRALLWQGNPFSGLTGGREIDAALRKVPFIVHFSLFPNATMRHSHVSLPMASWLERPGLIAANNGRSLQWQNRVTEAPGECRPALGIWCDLARAVHPGFAPPFPAETSDGAADSFLARNPLTAKATAKLLDPAANPPGGLLWPCLEDGDLEFESSRLIKGNVRGKNILFQNGRNYPLSDKRFPTVSGKVLLSAGIGADAPGEDGADAAHYPLLLRLTAPVDYVEDYGCFVPGGQRDVPRFAPVGIHPAIARVMGVSNGDLVTVENERGAITAPAFTSVDLDPGVITYPYGADEFQPSFRGPSGSRLFPAPRAGSAIPSCTRVTVYSANREKDRGTALIRESLKQLEVGSQKH